MEYVYIILRRELRSLFLPSGKRTFKSRLSFWAGWILYLGLAGGIGYGAFRLFDYIRATLGMVPGIAQAIELNLLNGISIFMLVMVFMSGIQTTYKSIYESDDIGFLMAQPVPVQSIFLSKFISSYVTLAIVALLFGLPVFLGFGVALHLGFGFYLAAVAGLCLVLLVAHSLVTFLLLVAMRYLPGRKMKQLFIAFTAIFGILIVLVSQLLSAQVTEVEDPVAMLEAMGRGQLQKTWYLPSTWMVNAVLGLIPGYGMNPLPNAIVLVTMAFGLSFLSMRASRSWFLAGWSGRSDETDSISKGKKTAQKRSGRVAKGTSGDPFWPVLRKDIKLLFRDPLVYYSLIVSVITVGFYLYNMSRQAAQAGISAEIGNVTTFMAVLMGAVTGAQTGGISISREGPSFWVIRGNPVRASSVFAAKFVYALLSPSIIATMAIVASTYLGITPSPWMSALTAGSMILAVASVQMLLDVYYPDFTLKVEFGSAKSGRGTGKIMTSLFSSMGVVLSLFLITMLPWTPIPQKIVPGMGQDTAVVVARAIVAAVGAVLGILAFTLGTKRMKRVLQDM